MSRVTINRPAIDLFFGRRAMGGRGLSLVGRGAEIMAERMAEQARRNVAISLRRRSGELERSIKPIVRTNAAGVLEVGVGSTAPHSKPLEEGSPPHIIAARNARFLRSAPGHPDPLIRRNLRAVYHPGVRVPYRFLRRAVQSVVRGVR